jgi:hypothetical protein
VSTSVHIYPLSKLVHASPGDWERALDEIERGKVRAYRYYLPLREAVIRYCKAKPGEGNAIRNELVQRARGVPAPKGADPVRDNTGAFDTFASHFRDRIRKFEKSLLNAELGRCDFGNVRLIGAPHFIATDSRDRKRYAFLLPSKWAEDDVKAYLELLSIIVEKRFGADPTSIWCMDLRAGQDVRWKSSDRMRKRCERAANLYARFLAAMSSPD